MIRRLGLSLAALAALALTAPALAHADETVPPEALWHHWNFDPLVLVPLVVAHWLYGRGWLRLPDAQRSKRRAACFLAAEALLFLALVSPLDPLGETLLSAHMVQHMLLVALAPPLLLIGRPGRAFAAALPGGTLAAMARSRVARPLLRLGVRLTGLLPATLLHAAALWAWHAPPAFQGALASDALHGFEHASFFGTALLFWIAVLRAAAMPRTAPGAALALFATFLHGGLLGGILSLAPAPLYPAYGDRPMLWGLTPLADQQLAGVLMWVPIGPVYLVATLMVVWRLTAAVPRSP